MIHRVDERDRIVVHAARGHPDVMSGRVRRLIEQNRRQTTTLDEEAFETMFDAFEMHRFGQTETEYKEWAVDRLRDRHTSTGLSLTHIDTHIFRGDRWSQIDV